MGKTGKYDKYGNEDASLKNGRQVFMIIMMDYDFYTFSK